MTVLVTGGTGVVGGAVMRHLLEQAAVRALVRPGRELPVGVEAAIGDVLDYESLLAACRRVDVVYHLAGVNRMCASHPEEMYRVNVDGTRNMIRAARAAGVGRLIYTSSAATIGEPAGSIGNEDTIHRGEFNSHYERSKYQAEQVVMMEGADLDYVIVNPSSVQGPGRTTGTGKLILDAINGKLPFLVDTYLSIVDIDDCARGHLLAGLRGQRRSRYIFNSFSMSTREALQLFERVVGRRLQVRYLPGPVVMGAAAAVSWPARMLGRQSKVCPEMVRTLLHGHHYDGSRATRELGLSYTAPDITVRRLVGWAATEGLIE